MSRPWILPLLAFSLALALRATGIGFLLPHQSDPDDHAIDQLRRMRTGSSAVDWSWGKYGHLVARTLWLLPEARTDAPLDREHLDEHLRVAGADHLRARWISALLGALVAPLIFWLARCWLPAGWSFVAAMFAATSLLHLSFSQQARPHVPFATLALLAVLAALRVRRDASPRHAGLLAVAIFLAVGTLHSAAFLLPASLAALLLREPGKRLSSPWIALPLAAVGASLLAFWPFLFEETAELQAGAKSASSEFPHLVEAGMFDGRGFTVWGAALCGYDPVLLVLSALGAVCALVRWRKGTPAERRDLVVVLAFALPCALVFGLFGKSFERFFLPLYPYLAVLAALALRDLLSRLGRGAGLALACLALSLPAYAAARLVWLRAQPDDFTRAVQFLDAQDPAEEQALLLHPRAFLPVAARVDPEHVDDASPSAWLRYLAQHEGEGRKLVPFPKPLQKLVTKRSLPGEAVALLAELPALGCAWALDVLPERDAGDGSLNEALAGCARLAWESPCGAGHLYAENGYQEEDMLRVVLDACSWGPRLALWRFP